jgi:lipopolysaccharide/colanic/teichoic acid biosynthesis glycosyltransferase
MFAKRAFDIVVSACALTVLSPAMVLLGIGVRLDSPGPALFRHRRVGRHGRAFNVLKFRTMVHRPDSSGPQVTTATDARITRLGALLRRTKLDELPQFLNVLAGDMSLVGPRPEVAHYVAMYPDAVRSEILALLPGMTDLASIEFRDEQELLAAAADPESTYIHEILPRKLELYLQYARQQTLWLDLKILFLTIAALFSRSGSKTG